MVLQLQGAGRRVRAIRGYPPVLGGTQEGGVIMHHDAVMQHCDIGRAHELVPVKAGCGPEDIVGLPLARPSTGIDQRGVLAIEGGSGAIRVRGVVVPVEYLDLIQVHQQYPAVAPLLACARDCYRRGPFQMELAIPKTRPGLDGSRPGEDLHVAVLNLPGRRAAVHRHPVREICAAE